MEPQSGISIILMSDLICLTLQTEQLEEVTFQNMAQLHPFPLQKIHCYGAYTSVPLSVHSSLILPSCSLSPFSLPTFKQIQRKQTDVDTKLW